MRIKSRSRLARLILPEGATGFAWGRTAYFKGDPTFAELVHEAAHVEQFRRYGLVGFAWRYCWEQIRAGYRHNRFEVEARLAVKEKESWTRSRLVAYLRDL